jgi:hypothetical protein
MDAGAPQVLMYISMEVYWVGIFTLSFELEKFVSSSFDALITSTEKDDTCTSISDLASLSHSCMHSFSLNTNLLCCISFWHTFPSSSPPHSALPCVPLHTTEFVAIRSWLWTAQAASDSQSHPYRPKQATAKREGCLREAVVHGGLKHAHWWGIQRCAYTNTHMCTHTHTYTF